MGRNSLRGFFALSLPIRLAHYLGRKEVLPTKVPEFWPPQMFHYFWGNKCFLEESQIHGNVAVSRLKTQQSKDQFLLTEMN